MKKLLFIVLMSLSVGVFAEPATDYYQCIEDSFDNHEQYKKCVAAEYKAQEVLMVTNYKKLLSMLDAEAQKEIQLSQKAWEKYKDTSCNIYAKILSDPDSYEVITGACHVNEITSRVDYLKELVILAK